MSGDVASLPHIKNVEDYGIQWQAWYMSMLPEIRVGRQEWPPLKKVPTDLHAWDDLRKGSKTGFVILLLGLSWWVAQAKKKTTVSSALKDMLFVVEQLINNVSDDTSVSHKRARSSAFPPSKR